MLNRDARAEKDRIESLFALMKASMPTLDVKLQSALSGYMAVQSSGFVEKSIGFLFAEYGRLRSNQQIAVFIQRTIAHENSFNCAKVEKLLGKFHKDWWNNIKGDLPDGVVEAVDSLKTIRDQIAHGHPNGTGILTVEEYYRRAVILVERLEQELAGVAVASGRPAGESTSN